MKNTLLLTTVAATALSTFAAGAQAEDPNPGSGLHNRHCVSCHDSQVYTRENRRVADLGALEAQVTRCENNLGLQWFDDQKTAVVDYLNTSYYHFK